MHRDRLQLLAVAAAATLLAVAAYNRRRRRSAHAPQAAATPASPQSTTAPATTEPAAGTPADTPAVTPAQTPASAAGAPTEPRARGAAVLLQNLKGKPEFNGREGRVLEYDAARGEQSRDKVPLAHAATRHCKDSPARSWLSSPEARTLAAWMPKRGRGGPPEPALRPDRLSAAFG